MTANTINYQQIYEEELSESLKTSLEKPARFFELSHQDRRLVEELEDALNPEVLQDTASLAGEMGTQLYNFANLLQNYLDEQNSGDDT